MIVHWRVVKLAGFNRQELLVVIGVVAILILILLPAVFRTRQKKLRMDCVTNLKEIGLAFRFWSDDANSGFPMTRPANQGGSRDYIENGEVFRHFQVISNELLAANKLSPKNLVCPADTRRPAHSFASLNNSNLSYFVGVDADETMPQMFLAGDRNLAINNAPVKPGLVTIKSNDIVAWTSEMHNGFGNIGMADGSVQQVASRGLQPTGTNSYRLAVP